MIRNVRPPVPMPCFGKVARRLLICGPGAHGTEQHLESSLFAQLRSHRKSCGSARFPRERRFGAAPKEGQDVRTCPGALLPRPQKGWLCEGVPATSLRGGSARCALTDLTHCTADGLAVPGRACHLTPRWVCAVRSHRSDSLHRRKGGSVRACLQPHSAVGLHGALSPIFRELETAYKKQGKAGKGFGKQAFNLAWFLPYIARPPVLAPQPPPVQLQPGMPPAQKQAEPPPARRHSAAQAVEGPRHPLGGTCSAAGITTVSIAGHSQVSSAAVQSLRAMCSPQRREDAMKRGGAGALQASEAKLRKLEQKVERMEKSHEAEASRAQSVPSGVAARHLLLFCTCSCPQALQRGTCRSSAPALALGCCGAALAAVLHLLLPSGVAALHLLLFCVFVVCAPRRPGVRRNANAAFALCKQTPGAALSCAVLTCARASPAISCLLSHPDLLFGSARAAEPGAVCGVQSWLERPAISRGDLQPSPTTRRTNAPRKQRKKRTRARAGAVAW